MSANARHSKKNPNWTTPSWVIEMARTVLGGHIELDPFSSAVANLRVQAQRFFTQADDGFAQSWNSGTTFINPPGLKVAKSWKKLCQEILDEHVAKVMWVGFSVEQLCVLADPNLPEETDAERWVRGAFHPTDFSTVLLRKRISFIEEDGTEGSPSHANYITGIGVDHKIFCHEFQSLGRIIAGPLAL